MEGQEPSSPDEGRALRWHGELELLSAFGDDDEPQAFDADDDGRLPQPSAPLLNLERERLG